jgi:hypothetical protein
MTQPGQGPQPQCIQRHAGASTWDVDHQACPISGVSTADLDTRKLVTNDLQTRKLVTNDLQAPFLAYHSMLAPWQLHEERRIAHRYTVEIVVTGNSTVKPLQPA